MANTDMVQCRGCGGERGVTIPILDFGIGPFEECGFCNGMGMTTKIMNTWIMIWKRHPNAEVKDELIKLHDLAMESYLLEREIHFQTYLNKGVV